MSTKKQQPQTKRKAKTTAALGPIAIAHDISWVTEQIAIGSCIRNAAKMAEASRQGITHILNLSRFDNTKLAKLHGIRILWNHVSDDLAPKSTEVFRRGVKFAKPALAKKENKLLIHCAAGWHRAPMMALAVLGSMGWKPQDAKRKIKKCRPDVGFPDVYVESVRRYLREESGRPVKSRMKVVFLDIDGVLINKASLVKMESVYVPDEKCVQRLNDLIKKTDANIVVSSCWRIGRTLAELRELLAGWGVEGIILDKTTDPVKSREKERGFEIQRWLEDRKKSRGDIESFVILDDNKYMPTLLKFLVQTKFEAGLTRHNTGESIANPAKG